LTQGGAILLRGELVVCFAQISNGNEIKSNKRELSVSIKRIETEILKIFQNETYSEDDLAIFQEFKSLLCAGDIRAAQVQDGIWVVNSWVKKGILLGFKMGVIASVHDKEWGFTDKHTYPTRKFSPADAVRLVPGGSAVRDASYIGKNVTIMPPSYINAGAYVDDGSMIDSHALVGSCAQVGKNVHLSAGSMLGGVLEPINANPVIVEDDVFIGGNCGIYEGVIVSRAAVIAAGVILTNGTPVYDITIGDYLPRESDSPLVIPPSAVVVAGSRAVKGHPDMSIYCPVIVKYRDDKTDKSVRLEKFLR
jgi:2,3,4,5-tetrahydropyridine-2-carboxylate N-succinyltransferase